MCVLLSGVKKSRKRPKLRQAREIARYARIKLFVEFNSLHSDALVCLRLTLVGPAIAEDLMMHVNMYKAAFKKQV